MLIFNRFCLALCAALTALSAQAAVILSEGFDSPILPGWDVRQNSTPGGTTSWFLGNSGIFPAHSGAADSYAAANFENAPPGGNISNWLITPVLDFSTGIQLSFFTRSAGTFADRIEVRISTNGASSDVGATDASVGDFTTLLLSINPALDPNIYPTSWTEFNAFLGAFAGTGRIAFRYFVTDTNVNADYIGIDSIVVSSVPEPASLFSIALGLILIAGVARRRIAA